MLGGILMLGSITAGLAVIIWCTLNAERLVSWAIATGRLVHLVPPVPPTPNGMPIERIAADLRRMRIQALTPPAGTPMARRRAIIAAYDDALLDACHALEVPTELDRIGDGIERESERLRTEAELARAGVVLG
jgi:hypothetical protein